MLALLDAFTPERYVWTVEAIAAHFGYTHSSTYRYIRELSRAGLLVRVPGAGYVIGARVVELDSLIRETDPLTKICAPILTRLARRLGCDALLSNVYGDHLINVVRVEGADNLDLDFVRGRRLPWFRGSPSMAILAFLPRKRIRRLFDDHMEGASSKEHWRKVLAELKHIAQTGYCISEEGLQTNIVGYGAPVIVDGEVLGSVSLAFSKERVAMLNSEAVGKMLVDGCAECVNALSS
jgi:DNA-binding IclR family transcriptional regulator